MVLRRLSGNRALKLHGQEEHRAEAFAGTQEMHERLHGGGSAHPVLSSPVRDGE